MIKQLTKKQIELMPIIRDKWINKVFQKSERQKFDEKKVAEDCKWLYSFCKLKEPEVVILDSPLACQVYAVGYMQENVQANVRDNVRQYVQQNMGKNTLNVSLNVRDNVRQYVQINVWNNVQDNVRDNVKDNVQRNVRVNVWGNVLMNVQNNVRNDVQHSVTENVWRNVQDNVWGKVGINVRWNARYELMNNIECINHFSSIYGDISDFNWISYYDYFTLIGIEMGKDFLRYREYCENPIFYSIQLEKLNIISRPPTELRYIEKDGLKKLHCEDAPAIEFADGYCQHYIHGVFITPKLFAKAKTISYGEIIAIKNIEQRYAILQMEANKGKMLKAMELVDTYSTRQKVLSNEITKYPIADLILSDIFKQFSSEKAVTYELYKTKDDNFFGEVAYFLSYHCPSTGRHYMSGIDPNIAKKGAKASILWKSGKTEEEFNNIVLHS